LSCSYLRGVYFSSNAPSPSNDFSIFLGDGDAIAYYLPGTTGWGSTFDGLPTVLWNPQVQTSAASFGVRSNQFGFTVAASFGVRTNQFGFIIPASSNLVVVVEASANLANPTWYPVGTNTLTLASGSSYFSDPQWTNYPGRFYRLRWP
jgi:hypothetical protein